MLNHLCSLSTNTPHHCFHISSTHAIYTCCYPSALLQNKTELFLSRYAIVIFKHSFIASFITENNLQLLLGSCKIPSKSEILKDLDAKIEHFFKKKYEAHFSRALLLISN